MINEILEDAKTRMGKSVESLKGDLAGVRTGRANTALIDGLTVSYYGNATPINQVANVAVADSRTLTITPWEKDMVAPIEKAIMTSSLGLNPVSAGLVIRLPLPPLTEERRKEMVKVVHGHGENCKIAIRNIRRDANQHLKSLQNEKEITEDELHGSEQQVQDITDKYVAKVDSVVQEKEKELMEV
ncbi:MAG TPA: ribosome recycling factor [Gammaproteobacteria bacterium]|nr:ribosome recycling factor [Xanthomonadales bacterium]MCB1594068.1 ribosome recycling factor [Xanthomonadales bacterium]HOP22556.1 ribosome recycling factor [Gammaproteobacteria bacterium]HPI95979.1 ribosome recycling factor [Gammaproteobacteria bacterium]HPQ87433.1 ribosome recycling factor [Gammaproteobacteria bacterium]